MFSIKLSEPKILTSTMSIVSDFVTEATLTIDKDGIRLVAMDPANVSMVILKILPSAFTEFSVDERTELTLNLDNLTQALKRAKASDTIWLTQERNKLKLTISGKSTKRFYIPLLEKPMKERSVPALEFMARLELDANEFKDFIEDASVVSDSVVFNAEKNLFVLSAGSTGNKLDIELTRANDALLDIAVGEPARAIYSVEYLKKMVKSATLADSVTVQFSNDYPLRLDFKALNKFQMSFILAPRIENR